MDVAVSHVEVERTEHGGLLVRWHIDGGTCAVDVAVGPTPEAVDHDHSVTVEAGTNATLLSGLGPGRRYVSVSPHGTGGAVVAAERRVPFEGVANFRDLGGYRTKDGGRVRWGTVFRADALHGLTSADLALYDHLGMRVVFDLRGNTEREIHPNPVDSVHLSLLSSHVDDPDARRATYSTLATAEDGARFLRDIYVGMLGNAAALVGRLLTSLTEPDGVPAVFHCAAGKDRTGITAALLLELLRVEREDVLDDYELTGNYSPRVPSNVSLKSLVESGLAPEAAAGVMGVPRWAMAEALEELDGTYGGIDAYLIGPAGMAPDDVEQLRRRLVSR